MPWVHDVMTRNVLSASPTATVSEVLELVANRGLDCVPVLHRGRLLGLLSRRELDNAVLTTVVSDAMHSPPVTVSIDATLDQAAALMNEHDVDCLLVTDESEFYGIVTRGDLLRAGVPEDQVIGERRCSACGTYRHVHRRQPSGLMLCASCAERGHAAGPDDELGVGD